MAEPTIRLVNVSKSFGEVKSLQNVNLEVYPGEVVGLLGDNGAGKSTLVKIITGYHQPDPGGEIYFHGQKVDRLTVQKARDLGVETVYQEKALADQQSVWRNIFMGREIRNSLGFMDVGKMRAETERLMTEHMGFTSKAVNPDTPVRTMSGGERQGIAITRALYFEAELIILDEPTMALSLSETRKVLDFIAGIPKAGKAGIFIDHNIFHVYPVVDRIVVLDRGMIAGEFKKSDVTLDELIERLYTVARTGQAGAEPGRKSMTAKAAAAPRTTSRSGLAGFLRAHTLQIGITIVMLLIWSIFAIGSPETFFAFNIYQAFMSTTPFFGIVALPLTMVVITGEMDLSFPALMSFGMLVFSTVMLATGNLWLALAPAWPPGCWRACSTAGSPCVLACRRWSSPSARSSSGAAWCRC